ncbi:MAG TPA: POTRA domain-containing protein, partial [Candidatus Fermentibacter sp.]|nr:POTRA domain-containing protein [Candidatus Fermentibacter sp.]
MLQAALASLALASASGSTAGAVVDSISISGAEDFGRGALLDGSGLRIGASLMEITPSEVRSAILSNLTSEGYIEATVEVQWPEWYEETGIVRIEVSEGRRSLLGPLVFTGNSVMSARDLLAAVGFTSGVTLTPGVIDDLRSSLLELYSKHGYVLASVETSLLPFDPASPDSLPAYRGVECDISEGRQIRLGSVEVLGLETVRRTVVTREILLSKGDSLDMEMMRRSISAIYDLGLFSDVRFVYDGLTEGRDSVDLRVQVTERPYRQLDLGAGYASPSALILSAYWMHPNIMGNNQSLTIGSGWTRYFEEDGGDIVEPELLYEEPYIASTRWKGSFRLSYLYFSLPGLEERGYGGEVAVTRSLAEDVELKVGYSLSRNKYYEVGSGGVEEEYDWTTTSQIGASLELDSRDEVLDPRTGHFLRGAGALSGGLLGGRSFY